MAGSNISWLVEKDPLRCACLKNSHPNATIYQVDVRDFLIAMEEKRPGYPTKDDVDHIWSLPPCKCFSQANRNGGRNDKENNEQFFDVMRVLDF